MEKFTPLANILHCRRSDGIDNDKSFFVHYQSHSEETFNKKYHPSPVLSNKATKKLYLQVLLQFLHFTVSPN